MMMCITSGFGNKKGSYTTK